MNEDTDKVKYITDFFKELAFKESTHEYFLNSNSISISVSGIVHKFVIPFDIEGKSCSTAKKMCLSQEEVKEQWKKKAEDACTQGTKVHKFAEQYTFNRRYKPTNGYERAVTNFFKCLPEHIIPVAVEVKMYHKKYVFAGTCDTLLFNKTTGNYILTDYKGLPLSTPIFTNNGWKTMGTISIKDKVYDKEGKLCSIKNISSIHNKKCLKIKFNNGEEIISDFEHRWEVSRANSVWSKDYVMTTQEIKEFIDDKKQNGKYNTGINILKIKNPKPLYNKSIKLPIDPYVFGVWLGDGHKIDGKITQANKKVWDDIERRGYKLGKDVSQNNSGKAQTRTVFGLAAQLRLLGLKNNKHVPSIFLQGSEEQRIELLRGFMDADGYFNKKRKRFVITTTKNNQVEFSVQLLGSLGIKSTVIPCLKYCNNKEIQGWDICFYTSLNPFLNRNEDIKVYKKQNNQDYRNIISVEEVNTLPTKCIEVDSESHTYLYGHSFIKTHNTNYDLFKNFARQKLLGCFSDLLENNFNKYQIQLSLYQLLFEQTGLKIEDRRIIHLRESGDFLIYKTEDYTERLQYYLENEYNRN